jgi:hypothetical protein
VAGPQRECAAFDTHSHVTWPAHVIAKCNSKKQGIAGNQAHCVALRNISSSTSKIFIFTNTNKIKELQTTTFGTLLDYHLDSNKP